MDKRPILIVSNRGPLSFSIDEAGTLAARRGAGGLVSGLLPLVTDTETVWMAAALSDADRHAASEGIVEHEGVRAQMLALDPGDHRAAYDVIGNATLWFLHHGLFDLARRPRFDRAWHEAWSAYRRVNVAYADAIGANAAPDAVVLVQDYHLALLGPLLADRRSDLTAVHFSHTPFAGPDLLRTLPATVRTEMLEGMAGHHACGFHTERWAQGFRLSCEDAGVAPPRTFVASLGPDPADLGRAAGSVACDTAVDRLRDQLGDRQVVARVDRIELSKNIVRGFLAFDDLLDRYPEHRNRVTFVASIYPSREGLAEYLAYRQEVASVVEQINRRWGSTTWTPILLDESDDFPTSVAALRLYDVLLVNPVRDGLNLVAKEGPVVNERDGSLVLSTEAGAWDELGPAAFAVDPCDIVGTADALHAALTIGPSDRATRAAQLRQLSTDRSPADWLNDQLTAAR